MQDRISFTSFLKANRIHQPRQAHIILDESSHYNPVRKISSHALRKSNITCNDKENNAYKVNVQQVQVKPKRQRVDKNQQIYHKVKTEQNGQLTFSSLNKKLGSSPSSIQKMKPENLRRNNSNVEFQRKKSNTKFAELVKSFKKEQEKSLKKDEEKSFRKDKNRKEDNDRKEDRDRKEDTLLILQQKKHNVTRHLVFASFTANPSSTQPQKQQNQATAAVTTTFPSPVPSPSPIFQSYDIAEQEMVRVSGTYYGCSQELDMTPTLYA